VVPVLDLHSRSVDDLLTLLDDKTHRVAAAVELCHRGDERAVRPVFQALRRLGRSDAVRVMGAIVRFGPRVRPALIANLASHKAYVRHGSALALAHIGGEEGIDAIVDLLLSEPTEIWREIARAVGHAGAAAIMPLASRLTRPSGRTIGAGERIAWAMAHIAARGNRPAVETLAGGQNATVSAVARHALEMLPAASRDDLQVRGSTTPRDQTVNRAFSRRFFEALERGESIVANPELVGEGLDISGPAMMLDEADFLALDEEGIEDVTEALDESDLLPS
jgi:hypothetical protein